MSLHTAKIKLEKAIKDALTTQKDAGAKSGALPEEIISNYSKSVADAVQVYMESAIVVGNAIVPPRVAVNPAFGAGSAPGGPEVFAKGKVKFPTNVKLKFGFDAAQDESKKAASKDGAKPDDIIKTLAKEMASAIHDFAITAIVTVDLPTTPGKPVIGFMLIAPPAPPAPIPAFTLGIVGKGVGNLT